MSETIVAFTAAITGLVVGAFLGTIWGEKIGITSVQDAACEYIANNDIKVMRACQDKPTWKR